MNGRRVELKLGVMIDLADGLASLSVAKLRQVGAVVFDAGFRRVLAIGYNGPFAGRPHEESGGDPSRPSGDAHAEVNALMKVDAREGAGRRAVMLVTCAPCSTCAGYIVNSDVVGLVLFGQRSQPTMRREVGLALLSRAGIKWARYMTDDGARDVARAAHLISQLQHKEPRV